ncbi:hypothetical protein [Thiobacillus denitrificans]|uniref:Uncharacterized protein n=1 Tax=Thiobacillus denitrificans TaxID=36861 RepID=A0A106BJ60_THIDE|nr:hypothetical protein [Thiobacillus denitrificans]KVW93460.1 hypothetical protein ABW22_14000 [Thiobacillus denitrificans]
MSEQLTEQPTIRLPHSLSAWGTPEFEAVLKREIEQLDAGQLPLQQGLAGSSYVTERPFQAMLISASEGAGLLRVKAGIFYTGIIAGCSCADDPTPIDELNEYCVVQLDIDTTTAAATTVTLLAE